MPSNAAGSLFAVASAAARTRGVVRSGGGWDTDGRFDSGRTRTAGLDPTV